MDTPYDTLREALIDLCRDGGPRDVIAALLLITARFGWDLADSEGEAAGRDSAPRSV